MIYCKLFWNLQNASTNKKTHLFRADPVDFVIWRSILYKCEATNTQEFTSPLSFNEVYVVLFVFDDHLIFLVHGSVEKAMWLEKYSFNVFEKLNLLLFVSCSSFSLQDQFYNWEIENLLVKKFFLNTCPI